MIGVRVWMASGSCRAFQTLRQRHVELVQARKSGGLTFEEDGCLLAADVDYDVGVRAVERGGIARRAVGQGWESRCPDR